MAVCGLDVPFCFPADIYLNYNGNSLRTCPLQDIEPLPLASNALIFRCSSHSAWLTPVLSYQDTETHPISVAAQKRIMLTDMRISSAAIYATGRGPWEKRFSASTIPLPAQKTSSCGTSFRTPCQRDVFHRDLEPDFRPDYRRGRRSISRVKQRRLPARSMPRNRMVERVQSPRGAVSYHPRPDASPRGEGSSS